MPRLGAGMEVGWSELNGLDDLRDQRNADGSINTHRPQEPENAAEGPEVLTSAELIIVPAFAVDEHGFRLGRGGGWYDRALEHRSSTARVVAVCWPWEPTDETVPHEPHDIPVDACSRRWLCRCPRIGRLRGRLRERTRICPVKKFGIVRKARISCLLTITVARTATTTSPSSSRSPTIRSPFARNAGEEQVRKVYSAVPIEFKGSGFYRTDKSK